MQDFYYKAISCITFSKRPSIHKKIIEDKSILYAFTQFFKRRYLKLIVLLFIGLLPGIANATHIVGGVLTYVYNGNNNYTLSLVLYRDCAGNPYPNNAVVTITQADGTAYTTLTLNPGTATNVPYTLDSCAQAPSPIPCVQKRTYTGSITLPLSANGYHMYYSLCCRNSTLSNTTTSDQTTNQDGESFYAFVPGRTIWDEDFTLANNTTTDGGSTKWTSSLGTTPPTYASVQGNVFEFSGANNAQATWTSQFIKISSYTSGVNLSVDLAETSNLEANDSILVYYRLTSGGALTPFTTIPFRANDFGTATSTVTGLIADSVQIVVRVHYDGSSAGEIYDIDNVLVYNSVSNNTPVYTQFPPLFMCAGKAFSVDHSATDADADSLYYSFYTPYNDAAPTFSGNVATFTPIIWNAGYSASSPLNSAGPSLTLNSSTGLLTGTGNTIGQFQVGIKTTEYRKGVKLSEMVRDFQFNVINCPLPAQAYITASGVTNGTLSVCSGSSLTFPNNSDPAASNWTWNFGDLTTLLDVSTLQYPSYTYPGPGTYTARMIINAGTACADTATAVVTVATPPATPTAAGTTICQGSTATLTATAPGGTYQWYDASSGGTLLVTNASYTTPTLTVTTTYYVQTTISGCASARKAVTVTVTPTPAAPTAPGTTICQGSTATLTATAPGGTYAWYNAASGGTLLITNASYTTPTLTVTTTYYVQTTLSGCVGPRTAVTVTVTPTPAAPTASGTTICQGTIATLTATAPGGTYDWYSVASGGTSLITNASYTTPTLTVTTTYYVQSTASGCPGPRTAVTVTVTPTPAAPTASGTTICTGTTAIVTATAPGGTYAWYTASSGGALLVTNASYTTPTLTVTTTYYVQTTVSGCAGSRTPVTVTVSPVPAAPTAVGTTICQGTTATLTATAPGGTYAWYDAASGGTLLITNASYTTPALSTNTTYYVQTTVAGCAGPRTAVTVTVTPTPAAPTASGTTICTGTTTTLTATAPGGTYAWYDASSGGTLLITNASYTTPTLTVTTTYYVQTTVSGCAGSRTPVIVTVSPVPAAPTAAGTTICQGTTATLTATAPGGTYAWYDASSGGTLLITNASYTTPTLTVTTTYYVQTTVAGCTGPRTAVTVTVTPTPAAPTASGTTICTGTTATLTATAPGGTYDWFSVASGGTSLITNASYTTPTLTVTTTYYVQTTVSGCPGPRTAVTVTVSPIPAAPTAAGATICTGTTTTLTATAPGGNYQWYDAASGGTLLVTNANYTTPTLTVTTTYYVQTTVAGCAGPRTAVTVTVSPVPAAPTASGTTICTGTTATLTATAPGGTYAWYTASSGGTLLITNASYTTPTLTVTTTYYVQTTVAGCAGPRTAVTVTVSPIPAAPTASGTTICSGNTATLTATAPGGTYDWYDAASGGTLLITNASYTTPVLSATTTYYVQTTVAGCTGPRTPVTVTVNPIPAAPTAPGTTICAGNTTTLTATAPGGTYDWYDAATGGTLLITNASYTTPVLATTTTYYVQTTVTGCTGPRTPVTVTVNPIPAAPTASGTTICQGTTATLTATAPGGTYAWYNAATGGTLLITNANYTTPTLTVTTTYYVQTTIAGCTGPRTAVAVTVTPTPAAPTASGTTICTGTTATLTATAPGGTYDWYDAASGGTLLVTNASYTTPTLTVTTTYYVQTTVSGCPGPRTAVTVTVSPVPASPTAANTTICDGSTATLTATAPGGTYDWYDASTGGTLLVTNASYTTPALSANTTYYVQTTIAGCTGPRTAVTVIVNPIPVAPTASGTTICQSTTTTLTATAPGGSYQWYTAATGGTLLITNASYTTPALSTTTTYYVQTTVAGCTSATRTAVTVTVTPTPATPTAAGTSICNGNTATITATAPGGTYDWYDAAIGGNLLITNASYTTPVLSGTTTYYVQTTVAGCASARKAVTVTVHPIPAAPTAVNPTICDGSTATLTATAPGGSYQWYDAVTGGALLITNASYTTPALSTTTTYYVQTTILGCTSATRTPVTVTVNPIPAAPTASGTTICQSTTATLTATAPGGTYAWYNAATGGTLLITNASYTTPALSITTTYYVQTTVTGCTSPRTPVTVNVNPTPAAPTAAGTTICNGNTTTLTATAPGGTYDWYDAASGGNLLVTNASYTTPALSATTTYYVQTTISGCPGPRTAVTVTVTPTDDPSFNYSSGTYCVTGANPTPVITGGFPGTFSSSPAGLVFLSTTTGQINVSASALKTYTIIYTTSGPCPTSDAVNVTVTNAPDATFSYSGPYCQGGANPLPAFNPGASAGVFSASPAGLTFASSSTGEVDLTTTTPGTYTLTNTIAAAGGCAAASYAASVTINPAATVSAGVSQTICAGSTATLAGVLGGSAASGTWSGGTGSFSSATNLNAIYTPGTGETKAILTLTTNDPTGPCGAVSDTVVININPIPVAPTASNDTICAGSTATLTATAPGGTYKWYTAASGGTLLVTNANYTTPTLTVSTTYYVQTTVTGCTSNSRTPVTVTVNAIPVAPTATGTTICSGTTATITATAPGGTYNWYDAATGGTLLVTNANYTTPTLTTTTTYYIQTTVAGCTGTRTPVTVTVNPIPAAPTAANATICSGTTATITATAPGGTYDWYDAATGGTLLVTNANYTTPTLTVTTTYYVQTTVAGCTSASRTPVTVAVNPIPAAPTAADATICDGSTVILTAIAPGGTYDWYDAATGGTLLITNANYTTPVLSTTTIYYVQSTIAGCTGTRTPVTVTVNPIPTAPTASGTAICSGNTATITATAPGGTYDWYDATTGGNLLVTNASYTTPVLTTTTTYYVQSTVSGCTGTRTAVTVTVNPIPAVPNAANATICDGSTATLTATAPGGTYDWYDAATGGNLLITNASYTTPALTTTTTYYVQSTIAGCTSSTRKAVTITVNPIPVAPTATDATICDGSTATLTATAPGGTYDWYDAAIGGNLLITNASYTTPVLSTTTIYYVQSTIAGCTGTRTPVTVTVNPIPAAPTASGTAICSGNTATITAIAPGGTYDWYDATTGGNLLVTNASYTTPVLTTTTTYYVQSTIAGCTGTRTPVTVTVNPIPAAPTAANATICTGSSVTLKATAPGGTYEWYDAATGGTLLITNANYSTPALTTTTTYYVQTTIAGCTSSTRKAVTVTVNPIPVAPTASGTTICSGNTTTLSATAPGGTYKWYTASGGGTLLFTGANYTTPTLTTTTTYYVQTTVAGCTSATRTAVIVTVTPRDNPSFNYSSGTYCVTGSDPTPTITGGFPGTFSSSPAGLSLNTSNGTIDVSASTIGNYSVIYKTTGPCPASDTVSVTITNALDATFSYSGPYCSGGANPSPTFGGGASAGIFSASPAGLTFVNTHSGVINLNTTTPGTYTITNDIAASGGCAAASHSTSVTINPAPTVNAGVDQTICAGSTATLAGTIGGAATSGTWTGGTGSFSSNTNLNATYTPGPGEKTATLTLTTNDPAGPCGSVSDVVVITIRKDTSSFNYSSGTYCISGTNPTPIVNGGYTGTFSSSPAGLSFISTGTGEINLSGSTLNTYTITFTTNGTCPDVSTASITVTNSPDATFSYSGPYCQSSSNPSPTFGGGASAGIFSASPAGLSFVSASSGVIDLTSTTPGTYTVTNTIAAAGGCAAASNTATVTIDPAAIVDAGPGQSICAGSTATLAGTLGGAATSGTWTGGTGSFSSNTNLNAVYTPGTGETTVILTLTTNDPAGPCAAASDTMVIHINPMPVAPTAANDTICSGSTATLTATAPGGVYSWYNVASGGTLLVTNASYTTPALTGSTTYYIQTTSSGCTSTSRTPVTVTVNPKPIVSANVDQTVCSNNPNVTLNGSVTNAGGGKWTTTGSGTFSPDAITLNATYTPSSADTSAGSIMLILSSTNNGGCATVIDTMLVTFSPKPVVNAGVDQNVCKSSLTSALNGVVSGGATKGKWTTSGSGTFTPNDSTLNATYTPSTADTTAGTVNLFLISTNNGGCIAVKDTVKIVYTNTPIVNAGSNTTVCANSATVLLNGTSSTGTGTWSTSGSGTFTPNNTTLNATYTPSNADTAVGNITLTLTSTGGCSPVSKNSIVTITKAPVVNAGTDQFVCSNNLTVTLNGKVNGGSITGKWTTSGTGIFVPNDSALNATYTMTTADTIAKNIVLILTSSNNGNCNLVKDTMTVTYTSSPIAHAGSDMTTCTNNSAQLNGTITGGSGTGIWTTTNGSGTFVPNNTTLNASYVPGNADTLAGTIKLVLTSTTSGGCTASTDTVVITVNPGPVVFAGADKTICANNANVTLSGIVIHATSGKWTTSGSGTFAPSDSVLSTTYIPGTTDTASGSVFLVLTSKGNGNCIAAIDSMHVTFSPKPIVNAGIDQSVCKSSITSLLNGTVTGGATTGKWITLGSGTFTPNDSTLNATYTPGTADTTAGIVTLILTSTNNGGCNSVKDTVKITYTNTPTVNAGSNQTVCANNANVVLNATSTTGTGTWGTSGTGTFTPNNATLNATYNPSIADTTAGTVILTFTSTGGCIPVSKNITITITDAPKVNAGADQFVCPNKLSVALSGIVSGGSATGKWTTTGTGTFAPNDSTLNATYTMSTADTAAGTIKLILTSSNNGNCSIVKDTLTVTFAPAPIANAGSDMSTCTNNFAQLNGIITGGSGIGTWTTTNGTGTFTPNNTTLNAIYTPGNADTLVKNVKLILTSTTVGGCPASSDTVVITVNPGPVVNAGTDQTICSNNSTVNLSGTVLIATGGKWTTSGTGTFAPNDSALNATYTPSATDITAGNLKLVLTSKGNGQCQAVTDTVKITFSPAPLVNAGADIFICSGTMTATLNGSVTGGSTKGKWTTNGSGTFTPTDSALNATYHFSTADTTAASVRLILTSTNNGNCVAVVDTVIVSISPVPSVAAGKDTSICANTTLVLNGTIGGGSGTGKWTTSGTGTFTPTDSTLNASYTPSATDITTGSVKLILTATKACTLVADSIIVTFNPAPTANASLDQTICAGNKVTLNGAITNASGGKWTSSGTGIFTPTATTLNGIYIPSAADITLATVKLILTTTGNGNCNAVSDSLVITIQSKPVANFTSSTACLNTAVNFTDASTGGVSTWSWNFGNGTSVSQNPVNTFTSTGNKTISLIVNTSVGCSDTITKNIFVNSLPTAAFTFTTFCPDSAVFTDGSAVSPGAIALWKWTFGDSTSGTLQNPAHRYSSTGTYFTKLLVTSDSGCVASVLDTVTVVDCVDKKEPVGQPAVPSAFTPNGDGHNDILFVKGGPFKTLSFRVFNEWGNEIFNSSNQSVGWDGTFKGQAQPAGTYVWTVIGTTVDDKEIKMVGGTTLIR